MQHTEGLTSCESHNPNPMVHHPAGIVCSYEQLGVPNLPIERIVLQIIWRSKAYFQRSKTSLGQQRDSLRYYAANSCDRTRAWSADTGFRATIRPTSEAQLACLARQFCSCRASHALCWRRLESDKQPAVFWPCKWGRSHMLHFPADYSCQPLLISSDTGACLQHLHNLLATFAEAFQLISGGCLLSSGRLYRLKPDEML